jgi:hypothetical protein
MLTGLAQNNLFVTNEELRRALIGARLHLFGDPFAQDAQFSDHVPSSAGVAGIAKTYEAVRRCLVR